MNPCMEIQVNVDELVFAEIAFIVNLKTREFFGLFVCPDLYEEVRVFIGDFLNFLFDITWFNGACKIQIFTEPRVVENNLVQRSSAFKVKAFKVFHEKQERREKIVLFQIGNIESFFP